MSEKDVIEMVEILIEAGTEQYLRFKYMALSCLKSAGAKNFMRELFTVTDKKRPLLLEMKGGVL